MKNVQMLMMSQRSVKPKVYGYLYNWYVYSNIAATGWSVPTQTNFLDLKTLVGRSSAFKLAGLRKEPLPHPRWDGTYFNPFDSFNFIAYPAGERTSTGVFQRVGTGCYFMTSTPRSPFYKQFALSNSSSTAAVTEAVFRDACSIRLVRALGMYYPTGEGEFVPDGISESSLPDGTYVADYVGNDLKVYKAVKIGNLVWTAENLAETLYNIADDFGNLIPIPNVTSNAAWAALTTGARCAYNNDENYV